MSDPSDPLLARIHRFALGQQEELATEEDLAEIKELLATPEARRTYLEYMQDSASLRWIFSGHHDRRASLPPLDAVGNPAGRTSRWSLRPWQSLAMAASLLAVASYLTTLAVRPAAPIASGRTAEASPITLKAPASPRVATVTVKSGVVWDTKQAGPGLLSRVSIGDRLRFSSGIVELTFDSGAQVKIFGPADFEISSPMSILCSRGRATTLVGESGKGFTIDTPKARIVDLGTQFGVDISEQGDTQVVVFQGSVDLSRSTASRGKSNLAGDTAKSWKRRLHQGDALMVNDASEAQRVVAVQRNDFFPSSLPDLDDLARRSRTIGDVRDNIRAGESAKCYQIVRGGLREDAVCFVDRSHQWNGMDESGLPEFLVDADYIMPFNDDKFIADLRVEVDIARPATCYVFFDKNMPTPPWLSQSFRNTGLEIGLDGAKTVWHKDHNSAHGAGKSIDFVFSIWSREIPRAQTVTFGGVDPPVRETKPLGFNMYGIAVVPK